MTTEPAPAVIPFRIQVPDAVLADLRERLARTRFSSASPGPAWAAGTDPDYLRALVEHWAHRFDWRAVEARLNHYPQFLAEAGGSRLHFAYARGVRPPGGADPLPLVLTHGWPSAFTEMLPLVDRLTDPAAHGADPADAFDIVIPSLPGFTYSDPLRDTPTTEDVIADLWARLMSQLLGYERFGAYGGDIGSGVTSWLAARHPDRVIGLYTHHATFPPHDRRADLSDAERAFVEQLAAKEADDSAYAHLQETRPDTLAAALIDSPVGLAAWIVEKFQRWGDCGGDISSRFDFDELLTLITLYWVTGCVGTSFLPYRDGATGPERPVANVPAGFMLSVEDAGLPREYVERAYLDIRSWQEPGRGGHFFAMEEPELLAEGLRDFFRPLRCG
ncbi:MAG: epoxide hydrolase [Sporichthyaceae bacterium]|nr:epoxide hydrolase [Sporichthyaceae bacterium]